MAPYREARAASIVCPFYIRDTQYALVCEGQIKGTENHARFATQDAKERYLKGVCSSFRYRRCRIARSLQLRYDEEEDY